MQECLREETSIVNVTVWYLEYQWVKAFSYLNKLRKYHYPQTSRVLAWRAPLSDAFFDQVKIISVDNQGWRGKV